MVRWNSSSANFNVVWYF